MRCPTWNFLAVPADMDVAAICAPARARALGLAGPSGPAESEGEAAAAFVGRIAQRIASGLFRNRAVLKGVRATYRAVKRMRGGDQATPRRS